MRANWKVRVDSPDGLVEHHFEGTLAELAQAFGEQPVRAIVWHGAVESAMQDAAKGSDGIAIDKQEG